MPTMTPELVDGNARELAHDRMMTAGGGIGRYSIRADDNSTFGGIVVDVQDTGCIGRIEQGWANFFTGVVKTPKPAPSPAPRFERTAIAASLDPVLSQSSAPWSIFLECAPSGAAVAKVYVSRSRHQRSMDRTNRTLFGIQSASVPQLDVRTIEEVLAEALDRRADRFLDEVIRAAGEDVQQASFMIFDQIERLVSARSFVVCDSILRRARARIKALSTHLMRSLLTITRAAKSELKERESLFARIEQEMSARRGPEITKRLLGRLA